jgi:hypothetical protein
MERVEELTEKGEKQFTPVGKLRPLHREKENVVLYSYGSFAPIHFNHVLSFLFFSISFLFF